MRINNDLTVLAQVCGVVGVVGGLGAYAIKPIFPFIFPMGVALTCVVTTAIACAVYSCDWGWKEKFVGFMLAYPIGLLSANVLISRVHFLHPMIALCAGMACLSPIAMVAFILASLSPCPRC